MARAVKSEIMAVRNSNVVSALRKDADDARSLCRAVERFVNSSSEKLGGQAYDTAREIASQYVSILKQRAQTAEQLADAIKSGCSDLAAYMAQFEILDDALRPEYEQRLREAEASLAAIQEVRDENGKWFFDWAAYFTYKAIIDECKAYLKKLDGLPAADSSAFAPIASAAEGFKI